MKTGDWAGNELSYNTPSRMTSPDDYPPQMQIKNVNWSKCAVEWWIFWLNRRRGISHYLPTFCPHFFCPSSATTCNSSKNIILNYHQRRVIRNTRPPPTSAKGMVQFSRRKSMRRMCISGHVTKRRSGGEGYTPHSAVVRAIGAAPHQRTFN